MKSYSEKELAIFHATAELLKSNPSPDRLKVADIATAAGIGKGTIYEYFPGKEQIVLHTVLYTMQCLLEEVLQIARGPAPLRSDLYRLYPLIREQFENSWYVFLTFFNRGEGKQLCTGIPRPPYIEAEDMAAAIVEAIYQKAQREGIAKEGQSLSYVRMALLGSLSSYIQEMHVFELRAGACEEAAQKQEDLLQNAYRLLEKALS